MLVGVMQTVLIALALLLNVVLIGVGIYLSSYLKKKAQDLATREEFKELEKQTAAITRTTAQIESDIKGSLWERQKRWELKREVLFEAGRRIAAVFEAVKNLDNVLQTELENPLLSNEPNWAQMRVGANDKWFLAKSALDESRLFIGVTCGRKAADTVDNFTLITTTVAGKIHNKDREVFKKSVSEIFKLNDAFRDSIRYELGIGAEATPK